jgi:hypothetical protein
VLKVRRVRGRAVRDIRLCPSQNSTGDAADLINRSRHSPIRASGSHQGACSVVLRGRRDKVAFLLTISHRRLSHVESITSSADTNIRNASESLVFTALEWASALTAA